MVTKEEIKTDARDLAERIRDYSRSQKDLWQQVPLLALEAQGRKYFSARYTLAYSAGHWGIGPSDEDSYRQRWWKKVDLKNGELLDVLDKNASYSDVLELAAHISDLDAKMIVNRLKGEIRLPEGCGYDPSWREKIRRNSNILSLKVI